MRCKNCGTNNDDNRYICETCGSPLYDEESLNVNEQEERTQTFSAVKPSSNTQNGNTQKPVAPPQPEKNDDQNDGKSSAEKNSIIVIAILVVVLIAIIASVIVIAQSKTKGNDETTTAQTTTQSTTENTTEYTTEPTTEPTTTTTTTITTTTTTQAQTWYINTSSSGGGTVNGSGEYKNGERVTITASAENNYVFDGWYSNGVKVSSSPKYTFTANENASFSAVFNPVETTEEEAPQEPDNNEDLNFGE